MILLVLVPIESPTGTLKKILLPIPQASLLPATIWLEARCQEAGMCTGLHKNFSQIKFIVHISFSTLTMCGIN